MSKDLTKGVPLQRPRLRVLVVEDDAHTARLLATLLSAWGHMPQVMSEGQAVLQSVEQNWPDVILLDLDLPGMDGLEVAKKLRERRPCKPPLLIAVTGYGSTDDRNRCNAAGIDLHLLKPLDPVELQTLLDQCKANTGPKA